MTLQVRFAILDSYNQGSAAPWTAVSGTSFSAPAWAAIIAIANQGRAISGLGSLDGASQTLPMLYAMSYSDFHDVTSGSNGKFSAGVGYDLVTGRGTPFVDRVVHDFIPNHVSLGQTVFAASNKGVVKVYTGTVANLYSYVPFTGLSGDYAGELRVAVGDVNGDGYADIVAAAGPTGGPRVQVVSGANGAVIADFYAYDPSLSNGVFLSIGDVTGHGKNGKQDIITGLGAGSMNGSTTVRVFDLTQGTFSNPGKVRELTPYGTFQGGVTVAAGDLNADGKADIITGAGPGGGPVVEAFNGTTLALLTNITAYDPNFTGGVFVAAGDVTNDGKPDIVTGAGAGGAPLVHVYNGGTVLALGAGSLKYSFNAYEPNFTGGVRVAVRDMDGNGNADIITGSGSGRSTEVRIFNGANPGGNFLAAFYVYDPSDQGGVYVG